MNRKEGRAAVLSVLATDPGRVRQVDSVFHAITPLTSRSDTTVHRVRYWLVTLARDGLAERVRMRNDTIGFRITETGLKEVR